MRQRHMNRRSSVLVFPVSVLAVAIPFAASIALARDAALVVKINGTPQLERGDTVTPLQPHERVRINDIVITDRRSKAKILFDDDSVLAVGPDSRLALERFFVDARERRATLRVIAGRFKIAIARFFGTTSAYEVYTPTAVTGVRGTVLWGDTELDAICSLHGEIAVRSLVGTENPVQLSGGQCVRGMRAGPPQRFAPTKDELTGYLKAVTLD
jgi:hypothetical protein